MGFGVPAAKGRSLPLISAPDRPEGRAHLRRGGGGVVSVCVSAPADQARGQVEPGHSALGPLRAGQGVPRGLSQPRPSPAASRVPVRPLGPHLLSSAAALSPTQARGTPDRPPTQGVRSQPCPAGGRCRCRGPLTAHAPVRPPARSRAALPRPQCEPPPSADAPCAAPGWPFPCCPSCSAPAPSPSAAWAPRGAVRAAGVSAAPQPPSPEASRPPGPPEDDQRCLQTLLRVLEGESWCLRFLFFSGSGFSSSSVKTRLYP